MEIAPHSSNGFAVCYIIAEQFQCDHSLCIQGELCILQFAVHYIFVFECVAWVHIKSDCFVMWVVAESHQTYSNFVVCMHDGSKDTFLFLNSNSQLYS